ncbi:hypothetical protein GXW83_03360 [Streptacidiphilus sp. PB12-B1b]|uniref:hypothetical protein n=1 Tax=Streptacidiphilus sp. PB12-B1b TaxID=2705012 RepID=UPI0015F83821|nr:hypothetical protein [Streptacidiphilus sp. PB12-B1b]QMU74944.1 hypothetical protein GXW83_03360 [Streptacidiphilus sp. PB12-B1b]
MGIESDQIVYDYLSRVGDLAQATSLTAAERARLVTGLRQAIDGQRGSAPAGSQRTEQAAVRRILSDIGTPADVVRQAVHGGVPQAADDAGAPPGGGSAAGVPASMEAVGLAKRGGRLWGRTEGPSVPVPGGSSGAGPGGADAGSGPDDWWRTAHEEPAGRPVSESIAASSGELPGWRAVYEPDFLDPGADERAARIPAQRQYPGGTVADEQAAQAAEAEEREEPEEPGPAGTGQAVPGPAVLSARRLLRLRRSAPPVVPQAAPPVLVQAVPRGPLPLVESLAVLVLLAATALGLWYVAVFGWFLAYTSRRLGQRIGRTAGLWLPLALAAVFGFNLYSQAHGRPGHPETHAAFTAALHTAVALWLRLASGVSAAFLAWQINRRR